MSVRIARLLVRVAAIAALVIGIVVMHHVAWADHGAAAAHAPASAPYDPAAEAHGDVPVPGRGEPGNTSTTGDEAPSGMHPLLHLCLAVLTAAALLVAGRLLTAAWRSWPMAWRSPPLRPGRAPSRPPPRPHGSALLVSLCVMRT